MAQSPPSAARRAWIDQARGVGLLLVILYHAGSYGAGYFEVPAWLQPIRHSMAPFRMPLLMLLAGLLLDRTLRRGALPFLQGRVRRLLWPFFVWTIISCIVAGEAHKLVNLSAWKGYAHLWFMLFLFAYSVVAVLVRRVPHLLVAGAALVIGVLAPDGSRYGEQLCVMMAYFFLGAFVGQHLDRFTALLADWRMLLLLPCAVIVSVASALTIGVRFNPYWVVLVVPALFGVLALLWWARHSSLLAMAEFVGRTSVVYYVVNSPAYKLTVPLLAAMKLPPLAIMAASLLLVLLVSTLAALAMDRSPAVRSLFEWPIASRKPVRLLQQEA